LTKALLVELKRVGCYSGPIGPVWTPAARKSMKAFTDFANATLPVDQPDHILLAMVQGHAGLACGRTCATGSARALDGYCRPTGVIAGKSNKHPPSTTLRTAKPAVIGGGGTPAESSPVAAGASAPLPMGRMSLAGPKTESALVDGEANIAATTLSKAPSIGTATPDARLSKQQRKRKRADNDHRTGDWRSKSPTWVPWAQPWAMN
jgi:hypothetical protein